jgi:hypothetical protein
MKNWEEGLEGNYLPIFKKYFLQPKLPSHLFFHSIIVVAFHQLPINYSYILLQLPFSKLLISKNKF